MLPAKLNFPAVRTEYFYTLSRLHAISRRKATFSSSKLSFRIGHTSVQRILLKEIDYLLHFHKSISRENKPSIHLAWLDNPRCNVFKESTTSTSFEDVVSASSRRPASLARSVQLMSLPSSAAKAITTLSIRPQRNHGHLRSKVL